MMTKDEYEFLTNSWEGPKGAVYNQVYEFCKEFGWLSGFNKFTGAPVLTGKGTDAVMAYQAHENYKRSEAI